MSLVETLMPYSVEGFLSPAELDRVVELMDAYKASVKATRLQAGATGFSIHKSTNKSVEEVVAAFEPAGRLEVNWGDIPREAIDIVETAFFRRIEDIRRAYPSAYGPYGFTYVEYGPGQYFTAHVDGVSTTQVAGFGVTLTSDFEGGEFCVETCGSGRMWADGPGGKPMVAPGADSQSAWYRGLPRTTWTTTCERGKAIFYGSGLTHSSKPVRGGVLRKMLAFISSDRG